MLAPRGYPDGRSLRPSSQPKHELDSPAGASVIFSLETEDFRRGVSLSLHTDV